MTVDGDVTHRVHAARIDGATLSLLVGRTAGRARPAACRRSSSPRRRPGTLDVARRTAGSAGDGRRAGALAPAGAAPPCTPPGRSASSRRCPARSCACWSAPGDAVAARQGLVVVEAMKMENELRAVREAGSCRGRGRRGAVGGRGSGAGRRGVAVSVRRVLRRLGGRAAPRAARLAGRRPSRSPCVLVSIVTVDLGPALRRAGRERGVAMDRPADAHRPPRPQPRARPTWWSKT